MTISTICITPPLEWPTFPPPYADLRCTDCVGPVDSTIRQVLDSNSGDVAAWQDSRVPQAADCRFGKDWVAAINSHFT